MSPFQSLYNPRSLRCESLTAHLIPVLYYWVCVSVILAMKYNLAHQYQVGKITGSARGLTGMKKEFLMVICMCQNKIQWNRLCCVPLRQTSALKKKIKIIIMTCQIVWNKNMLSWNSIFIKIFNLKDTFPTKSYICNQSCWGPAFYVSISG